MITKFIISKLFNFIFIRCKPKINISIFIITLIIMIVMIYVSNWITYAIAVADVYDVDFFTAFQATPEIIRVGDVASAYYKDLAMLYLFTALGAFSTIKKCFK